jgi:hypothetical protein
MEENMTILNSIKKAVEKAIVVRQVVEGPNGVMEVSADGPDNERVYYHPIVKKYQDCCYPGLTAHGYFGRPYETPRRDRFGRRVFISYFIPTRFSV